MPQDINKLAIADQIRPRGKDDKYQKIYKQKARHSFFLKRNKRAQ